jgi:hypothetical protein
LLGIKNKLQIHFDKLTTRSEPPFLRSEWFDTLTSKNSYNNHVHFKASRVTGHEANEKDLQGNTSKVRSNNEVEPLFDPRDH